MSSRFSPLFRLCIFLSYLVAPALLKAQVTTINVGSTAVQSSVKRFGINLSNQDYYDSGQMLKNLVFTNPSFEGEIYQSTIECGTASGNSCSDINIYSGFTSSFWAGASYTVISGAAVGRSGTVCGFSGANYPTDGGTFTFCDTGTAPASGDYIVVKRTMPPSLGWPANPWQNEVGNGTLTAETNDLPPGTAGTQSALLTAPSASDSVTVSNFFDSTTGKTFIQLNGTYQLTFKAKGLSGSQSVAVNLTRQTAGITYINQTVPLTGSWATYTINFTGSENGSAIGIVGLSFSTVGADTFELDDVSLVKTNTDPTNTTVFRDEVVNSLKASHPGVLRMWEDQLGESLNNLLAGPTGRQRSAYTPYNGFDGTDTNFQTQSVKYGLTDFLQLCQAVGADPWISIPSTLSTGEAYSLMDYLAGSSSTPYGAIRAASGQTAPWTSVFHQIHIEYGNEEWNGGTFKGGAIENEQAYGEAATRIFSAMKGNPGYVSSSFDLIVNGQSANPGGNRNVQMYTLNNDSFSVAPYMMYNITSYDTTDHLFGTTFAEAEAFVTPNSSSEGVPGGYITEEQNAATGPGKPIVTSEMNLSPSSGTIPQSVMNGYASSVGGGIAVLDAMFQQLRAGVLTQNLFCLPGYTSGSNTGNTMDLWGAVIDMGVTNRVRPQYLALQLANEAIGASTEELATVHTGADPTDTQYNYGVNSVTLPTFHFLQSFAFTGSGGNSVVVFNVNPDYSEQVNFAGTYAPTGTVTMQQLTSANITDTNENSNVVSTTSTTLSNFDPSSAITLPPYSMTVFTWGGSSAPPSISAVSVSSITPTSATITWTTDQASSSQVNYGASASYGLQSSLNSNLQTSHSVTLNGLTPGTTYDFDVVSTNSTSLTSTSTNSTFTTTTNPPVISGVAVSGVTSTGATITWTTDVAASSVVSYGTSSIYGSTGTATGLATAHSVTLTGLTPGTTYDFDVTSANASNASSTSTNSSFVTTSVPPVISAVASTVTSTTATITWTTDQPSTSLVNYGSSTSYGSQSALGSTLVTAHSVTLSGLTPGSTYDFDVVSSNAANQPTTSGNSSFATTAVPPVITAVSSDVTTTTATITWTTDQSSSSVVSYGTSTNYGSTGTTAGLTTSHSVLLTGLTPGTTYDFEVTSTDSANASATSGNSTFITTAAAPVISAVTTSGTTSIATTISWTTDQASSTQVFYGTTTAYGLQSTLNASPSTSHTVTLTGLTPGTIYYFKVASTNSSSLTGTSTSSVTTIAAPAISAVQAMSITSTSATITWTTDQASTSVVNYGTSLSYGSTGSGTGSTTTHTVTLTGLTPGTQYDFDVTSVNASTASTTSPNATFTTTPPPAISGVQATGITSTSAVITWTTDQASNSVVNYGTSASYGSQATGSNSATAHSVTITGLTEGTTYYFDVTSANSSGGSSTSAGSSFATTAVAPVISNVIVSAATTTTATISWTTDQPATSLVNFGTSVAYGSQSGLNSTLTTNHAVTITGLSPTTAYDFDVVSTNSATLTAVSSNNTFTTPAGTPPYVGYVAAWGINNNSAVVTWSTDVPATTQLAYGTTTSLGQLSPLQTSLTASHGVTLSNLISGTKYYFVAQSTGANGSTGFSAVMSFTTTGTAPLGPPNISNFTATSITNTSAVITWTTDQPSSSLVNFGTSTGYGSSTTLDPTLVTSHSVTLSGLTEGTTYDFDVVSANAASQSSTSTNGAFETTSLSPPVISNILTTGLTSTSVTVTWTTDQPSSSQVDYGTTNAYGSSSALSSTLVTSHSVTLTGLAANTTYDFAVVSANASSMSTTSPNQVVTTPQTTATPPYVGYVAAWGINNTNATVTWSTDVPATAQLAYGTSTALGQLSPLQTALTASHGVTLTTLSPGTTYYFVAQSTAANGATGYSSVMSFTTTGTQTTPPPTISGVTVSNVTNTTATISWNTDQSSSSQVNYGVTTTYSNSSTLSSTLVTAHSVTLTGLTPGTQYDFDVMSANSIALSSTSSNSTFTTAGTAPGPVISNVSSSSVTSGTATIAWSTDQASSSVVNYGSSLSYGSTGSSTGLVTSHTVVLTGLSPNTTYDYEVVSANAANTATTSTNYSFITASNTAPPPVISYVSAWGVTSSGATITWSTNEPANTAVAYGITNALGQLSPVQTALSASHGVTLSGLNPGTTYYFAVQSADINGNTGYSTVSSFTTLAGPPVISGVSVTPASNHTATVNWTTSTPTNSYVQAGPSAGNYGYYSAQTSLTTTPQCTLSYVPSGTIHYQLVSTDALGNQVTSADLTFTEP